MAEFKARVLPLLPTGGLGLLFMAYNADIGRQFHFTQTAWANNPGFPIQPGGPHGQDPVIGQNAPGDQKWPLEWDNPAAGIKPFGFQDFVKMKGGEYFFAPSLTFFKNL